MPYRSMPCGQATTETVLQPFQEWPAHRAGSCGHLVPPWTPHALRLWTELVLLICFGGFDAGAAWMTRTVFHGDRGSRKVLLGSAML
jgi:hypothetical protein